jgi:hypothetical protein
LQFKPNTLNIETPFTQPHPTLLADENHFCGVLKMRIFEQRKGYAQGYSIYIGLYSLYCHSCGYSTTFLIYKI